MIKEVEKYLIEILKPQLEKYGLYNNENIIDSIRIRMYSLLKNWNDLEYRNTVFLFSNEEALFYEPVVKDEIRNFVVTTIRNSLIESAHSNFYKDCSYETQLIHDRIKEITIKALNYFKKFSFKDLVKEIGNINDYYKDITSKYELAWSVLTKLANLKGKDLYFDKIIINKKMVELPKPKSIATIKTDRVIEDGMTLEFNEKLIEIVDTTLKSKIPFFTDSFKFLSRNFEKLLLTIEYILQNDGTYITFNYYISNNYISKRAELLKPAHSIEEIKNKFKHNCKLSKKHKKILDNYRNSK